MPPNAEAGDDVTILLGETVTLDGSGSSDPEEAQLSFTWSINESPSGSSAGIDNPMSEILSFTPDVDGIYQLSLMVSDGENSDTDEVIVTVRSNPPVASIGEENMEVVVGKEVMLDGSASNDPDNDDLTFQWNFESVPEGSNAMINDSQSEMATFTPDVVGDYVVSLTVSDNSVDPVKDEVTVIAINELPEAVAGEDLEVFVGDEQTLDASSSTDPDGHELNYSWELTSSPEGSTASITNAQEATATFKPDEAGDFLITLSVTDGYSEPVADEILINATYPGAPPVADAGADKCSIPGLIVRPDGSASSDPDGDNITYHWNVAQAPSGANAAINDATSATPEFTTDEAGQYFLALEVSDGIWDPVYDTVELNIFNPTVVNELDLNAGQTIPNLCDDRSVPDAYLNTSATVRAILTFEPGVRMEVAQSSDLYINADGTLIAEGTADQPIDMVGKQAVPGFWDEIVIDSDNNNSFDHVNVSDAGGGRFEANVYLGKDRRVSITNSGFSNSLTTGFRINDSGTIQAFASNTFSDNTEDALILAPSHLVIIDENLSFENNGRDGVVVSGNRSTGDESGIWHAYKYYVDKQISIPAGTSITIDPGASFYFDQAEDLEVDGTLTANGTSAKPIIFTSQNPDVFSWEGIKVAGSMTLDYSQVSYGGAFYDGNIQVDNASLSVSNSIISNSSSYGIYQAGFSDSEIVLLDNVTFENNADAGLFIQTRSLINAAGNLTFNGNGEDKIILDGSRSSADGQWPAYNYLVDGNLIVNSDIVVEPGAVFELDQAYIWVDGASFDATGTADSPIIFTAKTPQAGNWFGIHFRGTSTGVFDYVQVSYAGDGPESDNANIELCNSQFTITNSTISNSAKYGIFVNDDVTINSDYQSVNDFSNNASGSVVTSGSCPPLQ